MHNQRFFSYLSLFTFMIIILITANNFLLMFVGGIGVGICSYLILNFWFTRIPGNKSALPPLSKNILQKYPKLTAVFISSSIATLVGISIRLFFLWYSGLDLLNFPLHPILCSINLFSINYIRFAIKLLLEEWLFPSNVLTMNSSGEGSTSASSAPSSTGSRNSSPTGRNAPADLGSNGSGSDSDDEFNPSLPRWFDYLSEQNRARILQSDISTLEQFRAANPGVDPQHTPRTLRWRVDAYHRRALIIRNRYHYMSIPGQGYSNAIRSYNNTIIAGLRPPIMGETISVPHFR